MTIREAIPEWPNLSWSGSYAGSDKFDVDPSKAVIENVELAHGAIRLTVKLNGRSVSAPACLDSSVLDEVLTALKATIGSTLNEAGNLSL